MSEHRNLNENIYNMALMHALGDVAEQQDTDDSEILNSYMATTDGSITAHSRQKLRKMYKMQRNKNSAHSYSKTIRRTMLTLAATFVVVFALSFATQASIVDFFNWVFNRVNGNVKMQEKGD